jgi:hypothetical protein
MNNEMTRSIVENTRNCSFILDLFQFESYCSSLQNLTVSSNSNVRISTSSRSGILSKVTPLKLKFSRNFLEFKNQISSVLPGGLQTS